MIKNIATWNVLFNILYDSVQYLVRVAQVD